MGLIEQVIDQLEQVGREHEVSGLQYRAAAKLISQLRDDGYGTIAMGSVLGIATDAVKRIDQKADVRG